MNIATQPSKGTAVITGASTGIGAIYANRLARMGYDLIIVARNHNRLNQMASHITADTARNVEVVAADLGDANNLRPGEKTARRCQHYAAGEQCGHGTHTPLLSSDVDQMQAMINLNVLR
jgi:short-subunit dehydrogenase